MSMTLKDAVRAYVAKHGRSGKTSLALHADVSVPLIEKVMNGHAPKPENVFRIAVSAGLTEAQANELVNASVGEKVKATA